ncbi:trihelix transcription factor ASR3-like protein, partial [Tanacetum coccineum]
DLARSMPTSGALNRVAKKLNLLFFEVLFCFFSVLGSMCDGTLTICGEESFRTSFDHIREKDGIRIRLLLENPWHNLAFEGFGFVRLFLPIDAKNEDFYSRKWAYSAMDPHKRDKKLEELKEFRIEGDKFLHFLFIKTQKMKMQMRTGHSEMEDRDEEVSAESSETHGDSAEKHDSETKRRRVRDIGSSIIHSTTLLSETLKQCDEKKERRHRELMELERQRLHLEETRTEVNRQGMTGLITSINKLSDAIHSLISEKRP